MKSKNKSTGWIRTSERLPEEYGYTPVLFFDAANRWFDIGRYQDGHWMTRHYTIPAGYVTHWQPLDRPTDLTENKRPTDLTPPIRFSRKRVPIAVRYVRRKQPDFRSFVLINK